MNVPKALFGSVMLSASIAWPVTMIAVAVPGGWAWWRVFVATSGVLLLFFAIALLDTVWRECSRDREEGSAA